MVREREGGVLGGREGRRRRRGGGRDAGWDLINTGSFVGAFLPGKKCLGADDDHGDVLFAQYLVLCSHAPAVDMKLAGFAGTVLLNKILTYIHNSNPYQYESEGCVKIIINNIIYDRYNLYRL